MREACRLEEGNPGLELGLELAETQYLHLSGDFGLWVEQLVAESTGKHGKGIVPVWGGGDELEFRLPDPYELGQEFFRWEFATAVAGSILGINPFDQPNVQEAKDRTNEILKGESTVDSRDKSTVDSRQSTVDAAAVQKLLGSVKAGDYFAITAYLRDTPE